MSRWSAFSDTLAVATRNIFETLFGTKQRTTVTIIASVVLYFVLNPNDFQTLLNLIGALVKAMILMGVVILGFKIMFSKVKK